MTKTFIYEVAGNEFEGYDAWGNAWEQAKTQAQNTGAEIWRTVLEGTKERREFYANGGCFLNEKFYKPEQAKHF